MRNHLIGLRTLPSHAFPPTFAQSVQGVQVSQVVTILEANLCREQEKVLLLLDDRLTGDVILLSLHRLLRYTQCQHILVLGSPGRTKDLIARWQQTMREEEDSAQRFVMTSIPQCAQDVSVCITTLLDMQRYIGNEQAHPLFQLFDLVVFADVPSHPGPAWCQMLDRFAVSPACVIGLSEVVSVEEGELLFACVIDTKKMF